MATRLFQYKNHISFQVIVVVCFMICAKPYRTSGAVHFRAATDERLGFGIPIEKEISKGEQHLYTFSLEAGQFTQAVAEQVGVDIVVSIFGMDGKQLTKVDRPNGTLGFETASMIAPSTGEYLLKIQAHSRAIVSGRYRVTLKPPRAENPSDMRRMEAEKLVYEAEVLRGRNDAESFRQAIPKFERARSIWSEVGELYEEGIALYGAGICYRSLGENQTAILRFKPALELMRKAGNRHGIAAVSAGAGWSYTYLNELDLAMESFRQSLEYRQGLGDISGEGLTYYGIGWVHLIRGENQLALENFGKSLNLRREAKDKGGEGLTRIGLGKIYARLKRYEESQSMLNQALVRLREQENIGAQADALSQLGALGIMQSMDAEAKTYFEEALRLRQSTDDVAGEAPARLGLAVLARRGGALQEALKHIKRGVEIVESFRLEPREFERSERRMEILESQNKLNSDPLATGGDDYSHRTSFFAQVQDYYEVYIDILMRLDEREPGLGHSSEALYVSERGSARSLLDLLARTEADEPEQKALAAPLRVEEIQRRALDDKTVLLEYALGAPEANRSFLWLVTKNSVNVYSLPKRSIIEAATQRVYELLTVRNFNHSPQRREQIARSDARLKVAARELSQMLLGPVASRLAGKRLLIVPQGALQFVPFAALPEPKDPEAGPSKIPAVKASLTTQSRKQHSANRNWQFYVPLTVDHEIVVVPSASALAVIRGQKESRSLAEHSLIVFADPVFSADDDRVRQLARQRSTTEKDPGTIAPAAPPVKPARFLNLNRLSASAWEGRQIASLTSDGRIVQGFAANRDTATDPSLGKYRFIHFATHAVINTQNFNQSAIVLSQVDEQGHPRNGVLSVKDIYHLKLPVELVVLSACRTGLGEDVRGEGLIGLSRGFLSSGASRVMGSLWAVEDQATAEMMNRFYRRTLGPERMTPAAALRATQVEMWREGRWAAPYYWGGFVLQGEWR